MMKKFFKYFLFLILIAILAGILYLAIAFPPIMAGVAAKTMCSCVYVMGRSQESVKEKELAVFPGLASAKFDFIDSSAVTARILWSIKKAIYRKGLGCTLLAEWSEQEVRNQKTVLATSSLRNQDSIPWPTGNIQTYSALLGVNYHAIEQAIEGAFLETNPKKPKNTLSVIAVYKGQIVGEKYVRGFNRDSKFIGWSMAKSLTNALVGILVKDGKLNVNERAPVVEWQNDERKNITLNDLLHGSSGLSWSEVYVLPSDFHTMYIHRDDKGAYAASKTLDHPPGEFFEYSSGTANIISKIIRQTVGDPGYIRFPYERLFYKIGMNHTLLELDGSGTFVGSSLGYGSARDWARLGLLFLNDGVWNGERILPEGWVKYSSSPAPAAPIGEYGAMWWLNAGAKDNPEKCYHPGLPHDEFGAEGFEDQYVFIIPSENLVVVRLGISHHGFDMTGLVQKIIKALPETQRQ